MTETQKLNSILYIKNEEYNSLIKEEYNILLKLSKNNKEKNELIDKYRDIKQKIFNIFIKDIDDLNNIFLKADNIQIKNLSKSLEKQLNLDKCGE